MTCDRIAGSELADRYRVGIDISRLGHTHRINQGVAQPVGDDVEPFLVNIWDLLPAFRPQLAPWEELPHFIGCRFYCFLQPASVSLHRLR